MRFRSLRSVVSLLIRHTPQRDFWKIAPYFCGGKRFIRKKHGVFFPNRAAGAGGERRNFFCCTLCRRKIRALFRKKHGVFFLNRAAEWAKPPPNFFCYTLRFCGFAPCFWKNHAAACPMHSRFPAKKCFAAPAEKRIFHWNGTLPRSQKSLVQEKTRCVFSKSRDNFGRRAA